MRGLATESLMAPTARHQAPWFSFLVHLRGPADLDDSGFSAVFGERSGPSAPLRERILAAPPAVISRLLFRPSPMLGEVVLIPRVPEEVLFGQGRRLVARAVEIAAHRGARVVGLGGLTAPATRGGLSLISGLPNGVTVTNGNAFTAAVARRNVHEACRFLGRSRATVALLGSTGSIGPAVAQLLARDAVELILIGRSMYRVRQATPDLADHARFSADIGDVAHADVVLVLTADPSAKLAPKHFPADRDRVVIDLAQPPNIPVAKRQAFRSRRAQVVGGGWVEIPRLVSTHATKRYTDDEDPAAPPETAPACLAETWLFTVEGVATHAVGSASADLACLLERCAERRGIVIRSLRLNRTSTRAETR